ncbi:acyltransferase family protein [Shigella flexneri]
MQKKEHLNGLEVMRYLLGIYIVLYHTFNYEGMSKWLRVPVEMGFIATSSFFILSGFILSYVYLSGNGTSNIILKETKKNFITKRLANLYPIHIFSLLFTLVVVYVVSVIQISPKDTLASIRYVMYDSNNYTPIEKLHHFMSNTEMFLAFLMNATLTQSWNPYYLTFNAPAWSISTLFFMYILFPYIAPYLSKLKRPVLALLITNLVYVALPIIFIINSWFDMPFTGILNRNPIARLPEFISGILLCNLYFYLKDRNIDLNSLKVRAYMIAFMSICFYLSSILLHNPDWITKEGNASYYLLHNGLILIPECVLVLFFTTLKLPKSKILIWLGGASLPLFALHIPIYLIFSRVELYVLGSNNILFYPLFLLMVTIICILFQEKIVVKTRKKILNLTIYRKDKKENVS